MRLSRFNPTVTHLPLRPASRILQSCPRVTTATHGQTGMPSWVEAAGVPEPENVEPTKIPQDPGL